MKKCTDKQCRKHYSEKKKHDECFKNSDIMWEKRDIIDISTHKTLKKQECVFNHNAQTQE